MIAGAGMAGAFAGPRAAVLFVHGTADPTVPIEAARAAYDRVRWPKAFLALPGQDHGAYLTPAGPASTGCWPPRSTSSAGPSTTTPPPAAASRW
ncbi:hypothetical protein Psuf_043720 [Phytohabitans suffuscus]|uniref:Peptidase S9 prolyl oligopeptidase catalytic domain-containing protein n=1 Tax=Phytohabitans suffuscus TaxID=624315 RepID=A0A6F8YM08_9ACTN|nr:alpha/beta hydrolase [Phytohabitans suffuscus]BCB87059.1 hypothetical protein Psuf_043720 [Phytohabitans suffuscus]